MKRITIILTLGLVAAAALAAQPMMGRGYGFAPNAAPAAPTVTTIEGKLVFVDKYPAIQAKDKTYMLHLPQFFFNAYNDGIKEGATVKAEGYVLPTVPGQDKPYFQATKAVINGKTYELDTQAWGGGHMMGGGYGQMGGRGMMGDRGPMGGRGGRW
jgi:hypothetical protein